MGADNSRGFLLQCLYIHASAPLSSLPLAPSLYRIPLSCIAMSPSFIPLSSFSTSLFLLNVMIYKRSSSSLVISLQAQRQFYDNKPIIVPAYFQIRMPPSLPLSDSIPNSLYPPSLTLSRSHSLPHSLSLLCFLFSRLPHSLFPSLSVSFPTSFSRQSPSLSLLLHPLTAYFFLYFSRILSLTLCNTSSPPPFSLSFSRAPLPFSFPPLSLLPPSLNLSFFPFCSLSLPPSLHLSLSLSLSLSHSLHLSFSPSMSPMV